MAPTQDTQTRTASNCSGDHRYYVAEVVAVEADGKVFVLTLCLQCGDFKSHSQEVSDGCSPIRLLLEEKRKIAQSAKEN
jgi:hypothetical protein